MNSRLFRMLASVFTLIVTGMAPAIGAEQTHWPVAVRWWGQAYVSIETWWGLTIAIDPYAPRVGYDDPGVSADVVCVTHDHFDHANTSAVRGDPVALRGLDDAGAFRQIDQTLDRLPNTDKPTVTASVARVLHSPYAVRIRTIASWHDNSQGSERGANAMFLIETQGVRILHCGDLGQRALTDEQLASVGDIDVMLIPVGGVYTVDGDQAAAIVEQVKPRIVVPIHYKTEALKFDLQPVDAFLAALPAQYKLSRAAGNTLAASSHTDRADSEPRVVVLGYTPWKAPDELAAALARIDPERRSLAKTLASMTPEQLDHQPASGSHTVRWNGEHTVGAELRFFTGVFNTVDPEVPRINVSPAQKPKDYKAAHPDWSAAEEAKHVLRSGEFVRRFAYLLDGIDFEKQQFPGFWKNIKGLTSLLENHYAHHHGKVREKFLEPDWPAAD